ncbi:type I-E CRISPR-associated protein Cse1/CasA [Nocardia vaccinii]|uniref:type I-E CRISPR-associated protein Cse1/CasA n=1 Tax=Nocardia vaccinii TaxID=1822 RepID=UPI000829698A|nr:type I-E CRISPR-associated protein Cse1/CasA [Nocardia vaccinii]
MTRADLSFNLLDDPWIVVLDRDGVERQRSVLEVFEQAHNVAVIGGEVPTQGFAVLRLLLAFLHRALDGPRDADQWAAWWEAAELPIDPIRRYAQRVRGRFELFDPVAPFFQVADLHTEKGEVSGLEKIVADVPNGAPLFTTRSPASLTRIEPSEAARWLVHAHAFDPSGIKSGAVGDANMKKGKGYPIGTGWSGQLGCVYAHDSDLRKTLLLNLIAHDATECASLGAAQDLPPWEREPDGPQGRERPPNGTVDLYTWQSRRIRLVGDRGGVSGVVLANGDRIQPQNRHGLDPHTAWRYSEPQSKKLKTDVYMPLTHDPERAVWRGIGALLPSVSGRRGDKSEPQRWLAPGVLAWVGRLVSEDVLPETYWPGIRVVGAQYGAQSATFSDIVDDALSLSVVLLRQDHPAAGTAATNAAEDADKTAVALWRLAETIAQASGGEPKSGAGDRAREQLYAVLNRPYRRWLAALGPDADLAAARMRWQCCVRELVRPIVGELVESAGPAAWSGRVIGDRHVNVALAEAWFTAALRTALPLAHSRSETTTSQEVGV